ncbi:MAG: hypothetical protein QOF62_518, partial [Pyrinomonadaceae bacterium]|nr:hypothetical protein [Pyrinomonadaceae bacterium]
MENRFLVIPITHHLFMEAMKGVEPLSFGLQDRRSVIQLSYIATWHRLQSVIVRMNR